MGKKSITPTTNLLELQRDQWKTMALHRLMVFADGGLSPEKMAAARKMWRVMLEEYKRKRGVPS